MRNSLHSILKKLPLNPRTVFLVDGFGALLSALLLVFLLASYQSIFGMPQKVIYQLSIPAFGFTIYSLSCYLLNIKKWKPYLKLIAMANFIYCCVTLGLLIQHYNSLTTLGLLYFLGEMIVIFLVIIMEWAIIKKHSLE